MKQYIKKYVDKSAIVYGIVGIINTIIGYSIMFGLTFIGVIPELANALGYGIAFVVSYLLNKKFTFQSKHTHKRDFIRFALVSCFAYIANLSVLVICHRILMWNEYIALIIANIVYVFIGYLLHKCWTFR
ncbi:GtrA family protein [Helicobacter trogontum]|uniref:GtrA family protein n=1 Tax=Helicobacter trogontum TaxID=50960 RepID=A0A4U8SDS6_9HELI|nr:GtrA family protein [Helicobacter trogontum]TLD84286.1 GtrA family protein [Helicobacter trogontum]